MELTSILASDSYKQQHRIQYSPKTQKVYSTWTPRKSRIKGVDKVVFFGLQYFIKDYLIESFNKTFFNRPKEEVISEVKDTLALFGINDVSHFEALHDLGYLPLKICALQEGTLCPIRVPMFTIENTNPDFYWLTNFVETIMSTEIWKPMTSATIALEYRKICEKWADKTCDNKDHIPYQGHDFSLRGMAGLDAGMSSGAGHLTCFRGTDTIPATAWLVKYYNAKLTPELAGSVPATEHAVAETNIIELQESLFNLSGPQIGDLLRNEELYNDATKKLQERYESTQISSETGTRELAELLYLNRLLNVYPSGIFSYVGDTYNLWVVLTDLLPILKDKIMSRDGKVVIRPDSGDPCDIICGLNTKEGFRDNNGVLEYINGEIRVEDEFVPRWDRYITEYVEEQGKGVIELLWDIFGGTINSKGYKVLDPHIGCIYGDAITLERAEEICRRLESKGFASSNIVFGVGSYTYNMNTRDTFGFALKATYGIVDGKELLLYKDPITDDGTKKSQKGMVAVYKDFEGNIHFEDNLYQYDKKEHSTGDLLIPVFENGKLLVDYSFDQIREKINELFKVKECV